MTNQITGGKGGCSTLLVRSLYFVVEVECCLGVHMMVHEVDPKVVRYFSIVVNFVPVSSCFYQSYVVKVRVYDEM